MVLWSALVSSKKTDPLLKRIFKQLSQFNDEYQEVLVQDDEDDDFIKTEFRNKQNHAIWGFT